MNAELIDRLEKSLAQSEKMARGEQATTTWDDWKNMPWMKSWSDSFERIDDRLEQLQQTLKQQGIVSKEK